MGWGFWHIGRHNSKENSKMEEARSQTSNTAWEAHNSKENSKSAYNSE